MDINYEDVFDKMMSSASEAFGDGWDAVKNYAPHEFKKISAQIVEIADNVAKYKINEDEGYSPETGKLLMKMQKNATESVLVAVSALTLIAVQSAINAIFKVLSDKFKGVLSTIL